MQFSGTSWLPERQPDRVGGEEKWKKLRGNRMFQYPKLQRGEMETRRTDDHSLLGPRRRGGRCSGVTP